MSDNRWGDKARGLLGGEAPTPERVAGLMTELEELRAGAKPPAADPSDVAAENEMLKRTLAQFEAKLTDLAKAKEPGAIDQAIGEGRLPVNVGPRVVLGYDGMGANGGPLPRGEWFTPTWGPMQIPTQLCGCGKCTDHREYHFFCVVCRNGGPHPQGLYDIASPRQTFKRANMMPGDMRGLVYYACAGPCAIGFMQTLGQAANMVPVTPPPMERPVLREIAVPLAKPQVPLGSD